jgi:hypothetical protein
LSTPDKDRSCFPVVELRRGKETAVGTLGSLWFMGKMLCYTLEEPWRDNMRGVSCVPLGRYFCTPHNTPRFPRVWILNDVPARSGILIHAGNTLADTTGCILVGSAPAPNGVKQSQAALEKLRRTLPAEFWLEITKQGV